MYQEFEASLPGFERHVIDTSGLTPEQTCALAESAEAEGRLRLSEPLR
jgi:hypothetical protein